MPFRIFNSTCKLNFSVKKELDFRLMWVIKNKFIVCFFLFRYPCLKHLLILGIYISAKKRPLTYVVTQVFLYLLYMAFTMGKEYKKEIFMERIFLSSSGYYICFPFPFFHSVSHLYVRIHRFSIITYLNILYVCSWPDSLDGILLMGFW